MSNWNYDCVFRSPWVVNPGKGLAIKSIWREALHSHRVFTSHFSSRLGTLAISELIKKPQAIFSVCSGCSVAVEVRSPECFYYINSNVLITAVISVWDLSKIALTLQDEKYTEFNLATLYRWVKFTELNVSKYLFLNFKYLKVVLLRQTTQ